MNDATTMKHRCAKCMGRGVVISTKHIDRPTRTRTCPRCDGHGWHGERAIKSRPLAPTEIREASR